MPPSQHRCNRCQRLHGTLLSETRRQHIFQNTHGKRKDDSSWNGQLGKRREERPTMMSSIDGGQCTLPATLRDWIFPSLSRTIRATQASVSLPKSLALLKRLLVLFLNFSWRRLRSSASSTLLRNRVRDGMVAKPKRIYNLAFIQ